MTAAPETRQAWRCTNCGRVANAHTRPSSHRRDGGRCPGMFEAATIAPDGAVIAAPTAAVSHGESDPELRYRQSRLRSYYECARSTCLSSEATTGNIGATGDLGSAFHAVAAEIRRTLRSPHRRLKPGRPLPNYTVGEGESQMSTQECVEIMREVVSTGPWVLGPAEIMGDGQGLGLLQMVCNLAAEKWHPGRFLAIEERLFVEIACPDGEVRMLTGTPDLVIADPGRPPGLITEDDKTGMARPRNPRITPEPGEPIRGAQYLSRGDHYLPVEFFQSAIYWILEAEKWRTAEHCLYREKNWRWANDPPREIIWTRADLEHLIPWCADLMMKMDRGLGGDAEHAQPRSGAKCLTRCPVVASCPVPPEQRGMGSLDSDEAASEAAREWIRIQAKDKWLRAALKARIEETGRAPIVNDHLVARWQDRPSGKGRDFGIFPPAEPVAAADGEYDMAPWLASLEAQQETGAAS